MGAVYLARHETLDREVALKVLSPQFAGDEDMVQRMLREAKLAAKLEHPNVVQVHDAAMESGLPFIVMQYVEGESLQQLLTARGRLPWKEALGVTRKIAQALAAAHKLGIIHRDIKPANVLISKDGKVKVTDFGLARGMSSGEPGLTTANVVIGTPQFMSPEQARGDKVDHRSDLYSLGATLYAMLTGSPPYAEGSAMSIVMRQANMESRPEDPRKFVKDLPDGVATLVMKMLAKPLEERVQTAEEVIRAIDALAGGPASLRKPPTPARRMAWWKPAAGGAGVVIALILLVALVGPSPAQKMFEEAERLSDPEMAMFKHKEVIAKYPGTEWAKRSEARVRELQATLEERHEAEAFKAAKEFWERHPDRPVDARKHFEDFIAQHPRSKHVPEARAALKDLHTDAVRERAMGLARCVKEERVGGFPEFIDPKWRQERGATEIRRAMGALFKLMREFGWKVEDVGVKKIELKEDLAHATVTLQVRSKNEQTGEEKTDSQVSAWIYRDGQWYLDPEATRQLRGK